MKYIIIGTSAEYNTVELPNAVLHNEEVDEQFVFNNKTTNILKGYSKLSLTSTGERSSVKKYVCSENITDDWEAISKNYIPSSYAVNDFVEYITNKVNINTTPVLWVYEAQQVGALEEVGAGTEIDDLFNIFDTASVSGKFTEVTNEMTDSGTEFFELYDLADITPALDNFGDFFGTTTLDDMTVIKLKPKDVKFKINITAQYVVDPVAVPSAEDCEIWLGVMVHRLVVTDTGLVSELQHHNKILEYTNDVIFPTASDNSSYLLDVRNISTDKTDCGSEDYVSVTYSNSITIDYRGDSGGVQEYLIIGFAGADSDSSDVTSIILAPKISLIFELLSG